jgi:predicted MFS family arabinose efflux permease
MNPAVAATRSPPASPWRVALAGLLALAVAMGIGRFAFTPLLPMMLNDGLLALPAAGWLATANYLGYLFGALLCMAQPLALRYWPALRRKGNVWLVRGGLIATVLLTAAMALPLAESWVPLRFLAGVASAVVFVFTSGWCLTRLASLGVPRLGGVIYIGPGLGIAVSGLAVSVMISLHWSAATGWLMFALLALLLMILAWPVLQGPAEPSQAGGQSAAPVMIPAGRGQKSLFALAYGLAGFGYIISATFLPVIAREALPHSLWLDLFWPIFGLGVGLGAVLATRIPLRYDYRQLLGICYLLQAAGIGASVWAPSLTGFAIGSLLLGIPFTAITLFAMQEARRLYPLAPASFMGLLTAAYGVGQILGPPLVTLLLERHGHAAGFELSLETAAGALLVGALMHFCLARCWPARSE